ncbi:hypothetical protein BDW02DRAFT_594686 [Decorospora gaudefroyi]|uniref:F-box domain-containing protein n=1 Tax=Decorospora gaudefroyi TaxID=184978 RepID=A0A6A5KQM3_9PLEO|nr:hypothetical protein BDW02DRAFT_594686 [Decorospora gaudefroyi]
MNVHTLGDLNQRGSRSSSIPPQYHRMADVERREARFSVTDAVHLKLRIQALDQALSSMPPEEADEAHVETIAEACRQRPFHESVYVAGSEQFYLIVKRLSRPDLLPDVYVEAYKTVLQGRPYVNAHNVSDLSKGVDPTFSEIRLLLPELDRVCETDLQGAFARREIRPFAFLQLPAELRLQVYSYILPREARITLEPMYRGQKAPRRRLDIMRVNTRLHDEVTKYLYEHRTLFMPVARHPTNKAFGDEYVARIYNTIATMNPATLHLFKHLEIQISHCQDRHIVASRYLPRIADPMRHIFRKLTALETLTIQFGPVATPSYWESETMLKTTRQRYEIETTEWLIDHIPASVNVSWDRAHASRFLGSDAVEQRLWHAIQDRASARPA